MRKSSLSIFMLCLASIALLAGCKKEVKPDEPETPVTPDNTKPSLSIINQEGYIANGDILQCGTSYNFGFIARSNSQTNAELSTLVILVDNEEKANLDLNGTEYIYSDNISFHNDYPNDRVTITAILTDIGGKEVSKSLQVQLQKTIIEGRPSIAIMTGDNFITGTVDYPSIIDANDENALGLKYGFHAESSAETMKELASLKLTWNLITYDNGVYYDTFEDIIDLTGMTSYDFSDYLFEQREIITLMDGTITAVVTDVDNQTDTAVIAFTIQIEEVPVPLISSTIEWVRKGTILVGNTEEEMAAMGLKWSSSYKEVFATIEPLNDDVILYLCDGDDFDNIVQMSDKYAYFTNLAETTIPIAKYRNISAQNSYDYNDMLAVIYGEELNLIHINRAEIEAGSYGAQITIKGAVK